MAPAGIVVSWIGGRSHVVGDLGRDLSRCVCRDCTVGSGLRIPRRCCAARSDALAAVMRSVIAWIQSSMQGRAAYRLRWEWHARVAVVEPADCIERRHHVAPVNADPDCCAVGQDQ